MRFIISSDFKAVKDVSRQICQDLSKRHLSDEFIFDIKLACEEAMINAIKHGNEHRRNKTVNISYDITDKAVVITVQDQGKGFDYRNLPNPTEPENLIKLVGRGIFLIRNVMDKVKFNVQGNKIIMTKFF
jgi:serine/threonine-protein kinase RsbW